MPKVDQSTSIFYKYRGFNREKFDRSANNARQRLEDLQQEKSEQKRLDRKQSQFKLDRAKSAEIQSDGARQEQEFNTRKSGENTRDRIAPVSQTLSVPRHTRITPSPTENPIKLPTPDYKKLSPPTEISFNHTPINLSA